MNTLVSTRQAGFAALLALSVNANSLEFTELELTQDVVIEAYVHVDRARFDPSQVLLALPPGPQSRAMVEAGLSEWTAQLQDAGWSIISPVAYSGGLYTSDARAKLIPKLLASVRERYEVEFDKAFLFGISNGGTSALEVAVRFPELFYSVTVLPGILISTDRLSALATLPVNLVVGEHDGRWTAVAHALNARLMELGGDVKLTILEGADHYAFREVSFEQLVEHLTRATTVSGTGENQQ